MTSSYDDFDGVSYRSSNGDDGYYDYGSSCLESFQQIPVSQWSGEDCNDWAYNVLERHSLNPLDVDITNFKFTTGMQILQFKKKQLAALCSDAYVDVFYKSLHSLKKKNAALASQQNTGDQEYNGACADSLSSSSYALTNDSWNLSPQEFQELNRYIPEGEDWNALPEEILSLDLGDPSSQEYGDDGTSGILEDENDITYVGSLSNIDESALLPEGSPISQVGDQAVRQRVKTQSRRGDRGPKIWEFLIRLLLDSRTNPKMIQWHDLSQGIFVLNEPPLIAQLWGARANKPALSSNNFARALRYHYNTGALESVSERHYMYKLGPKALKFIAELKNK